MKHIATILILTLSVVTGCDRKPPVVVSPKASSTDIKENMINANRTIALAEETAINEYVIRRGWDANKLQNSVRVYEYRKGDGEQIDYEDSVTVIYNVEAINGKRIYTNVEERFKVGRRQQMVGIDNAVTQLKRGSKAIVILPSNTAYGIAGDGDRIPQSTILVLDLEVK